MEKDHVVGSMVCLFGELAKIWRRNDEHCTSAVARRSFGELRREDSAKLRRQPERALPLSDATAADEVTLPVQLSQAAAPMPCAS
jgi:hypothetical protein